jgi:hypothetical protein
VLLCGGSWVDDRLDKLNRSKRLLKPVWLPRPVVFLARAVALVVLESSTILPRLSELDAAGGVDIGFLVVWSKKELLSKPIVI